MFLAQVDGAQARYAFDTERAALSWAAKQTEATKRTVVVWASGTPEAARNVPGRDARVEVTRTTATKLQGCQKGGNA